MLLASGLVGNVGYFIAALLLARWLGPAERGSVAFATLSVLMLSRLARLGLPEATSVFAASDESSRPLLLGNQLAFATVVPLALAFLFIGPLELIHAHPAAATTTTFALIGIGLLLNTLFETLSSFLVSCGEIRVASLTGLVQPWGWAIGVVIARAATDLTTTSAIVAWAAPLTIGVSLRLSMALRVSGVRPPDTRALRAAVAFGLPAWVGGTATFVNYRFDQVLMGFVSSKRQLGLYAVGVNASEVLIYLGTATALALTPIAARIDPAEVAGRTLRAFRPVILITLGTTTAAIVTGPVLIPLVFGHAYEGSTAPFLILAVGSIGWTVSTVLSGALLGAKSPRLASRGAVVAMTVTVALDAALIPPYAAVGAAIATSIGFFAAATATIVAFTNRFRLSPRALVPGSDDGRELIRFARAALRRR